MSTPITIYESIRLCESALVFICIIILLLAAQVTIGA